MPRLTDHIYLSNYRDLRATWLSDPTSLFLLSAIEQWALHDYFQLSERLSDEALLEHRRTVSASDPSLPQQAGRAISAWGRKAAHLRKRQALKRPARKKRGAKRDYEIHVFAAVQPQLDIDQIAKILLNYEPRDS